MSRLEKIEKKNQGLREKNQRLTEASSALKKESSRIGKELNEKNLLFNEIPAGICLLWRGKIIEANNTFLDYMGYSADEIINRNYLDLVRHDCLSEIRFIHNRWNAGKTAQGHYDTWFVRESGESIFCSVESKRVRYRGRASYLLNITRLEERAETEERQHQEIRKEAENKMARVLYTLLNKRVAALAGMLSFMRDSKDINIPDFKKLAAKIRAEQKLIRKEIWMLEVIAKEKEEVSNKKYIEINRIINEAVAKSEGLIKKGDAGIKSHLRTTSSVNGNPRELSEAICELISCLCPVPGTREIHITTEEDQERIIIYLQDNYALPQDETAAANAPLTRQKGIVSHELGMSFVRAVIMRHNGEIESMPGTGQGDFYQVTLPAFKESSIRRKIDLNRIRHARILIIKKSDIAKELLKQLLIEKGCTVETAGSTIAGIASIKKRKINMVIADMDDQGMNNRSFWRKCREINPELITVGFRDMKNAEEHSQMIGHNPDLTIPKPYNIKNAAKDILELFMVMHK
ncbi:MAG: PAS domain S-box protein [Deltaproteobacteria bacterium]|nr:PAS domain S-box protein [Deltaproteobacteria bacterium]